MTSMVVVVGTQLLDNDCHPMADSLGIDPPTAVDTFRLDKWYPMVESTASQCSIHLESPSNAICNET